MDNKSKVILTELKTCLQDRVSLNRLILFGSRAREDFDRDSDLDVLVVVEEINPAIEKIISRCAWEAGFKHGVLIVPVIYSRSEWEDGPERSSLLALAVDREGVAV